MCYPPDQRFIIDYKILAQTGLLGAYLATNCTLLRVYFGKCLSHLPQVDGVQNSPFKPFFYYS